MNYKEFCKKLSGKRKKSRVSSKNKIEASGAEIIFEAVSCLGEILTIFETGEAIYSDPDSGRATVFAVISYWLRRHELDSEGIPVYSYRKCESLDEKDEFRMVPLWVSHLMDFGYKRIDHNARAREKLVYIDNLDFDEKERYMRVESFESNLCDSLVVGELIKCLSKKRKLIVILRYADRLTYREIAEILNRYEEKIGKEGKNSKETVNKELRRALVQMRKKLSK